jgi:site-specific DNA recombinase
MKDVFAYIRVSTARQGEQGVSLAEQRDAIARYAAKNELRVLQWYEEQETAAKRGRPVFGRMIKQLLARRVAGVVIHKIDRSARNLRDWADLGELVDRGVEVHLAHEALDLRTRGGRLTADIQAVIAADYVRNLREECRKGFYGRLKQGLWPCPAPLGYADQGAGRPKVPSEKAPLIREMFELYATGRYSTYALTGEMHRRGLRNRNGRRLKRNELTVILHNTFYIGLIRIRKTGESFDGRHEPIVPASLFERVQTVMAGKAIRAVQKHELLFRRMVRCGKCRRHLVGERQKGHTYYRCHSRHPSAAVREEILEQSAVSLLKSIRFNDEERKHLSESLAALAAESERQETQARAALNLRLDQVASRLRRLTDVFVDAAIDQDTFAERKAALLKERCQIEERLSTSGSESLTERVRKTLELADCAYLLYENGSMDEKRELLMIVSSNRRLEGKTPVFTPAVPFNVISDREEIQCGGSKRATGRTATVLARLLRTLAVTPIEFPEFLQFRDAA